MLRALSVGDPSTVRSRAYIGHTTSERSRWVALSILRETFSRGSLQMMPTSPVTFVTHERVERLHNYSLTIGCKQHEEFFEIGPRKTLNPKPYNLGLSYKSQRPLF